MNMFFNLMKSYELEPSNFTEPTGGTSKMCNTLSVSNVPISMVRNYAVMGWKQDSDQPDNTPPRMRVSPGGNGTSVRDPIGEGCSHGAGILPLGGPEILSIGPKRSGAGDLDRPDELCAGPRRPFFGISSGAGDLDLSRKLSVGPSSSMPFFGISSGAGDLDLPLKLSVGPSPSMPFLWHLIWSRRFGSTPQTICRP